MTSTLKVFGVPGAGKTHFLVDWVHDQLKVYAPEEICCTTFTRAAAAELRRRLGVSREQARWWGTTHSVFFRMLGLSYNSVMTIEDHRIVADRVDCTVTREGKMFVHRDYWDAHALLGRAARSGVPASRLFAASTLSLRRGEEFIERVADELLRYKMRTGRIEYDDALHRVVREQIEMPNIKVFVHDEAQDSTRLHWRAFKTCFTGLEKRLLAGDPDQTIYGMLGADPTLLLAQRGEIVHLTQSQRVPAAVADIGNLIGRRIPAEFRANRRIIPARPGGSVLRVSALADALLHGRTMILSRTNYGLRRWRDEMRRRGVIFQQREMLDIEATGRTVDVERSSVMTHTVRRIQRLEALRDGEPLSYNRATALRRHLRADVRTATTLPRLATWADLVQEGARALHWSDLLQLEPDERDYLRAIERRGLVVDPSLPVEVVLSTIHSAKGQEADTVVLDLRTTKRDLPTAADLHNEHRVWYVGATRARERLVLCAPPGAGHYYTI